MEREINIPVIRKIGESKDGNGEYQVSIYNRGIQMLAIGVNKEEAERIKDEYIKKQIKKSISGHQPTD